MANSKFVAEREQAAKIREAEVDQLLLEWAVLFEDRVPGKELIGRWVELFGASEVFEAMKSAAIEEEKRYYEPAPEDGEEYTEEFILRSKVFSQIGAEPTDPDLKVWSAMEDLREAGKL